MPRPSRSTRALLTIIVLIATSGPAIAAELPKDPDKLTPAGKVDAFLAVLEDGRQTTIKRRYAAGQIMKLNREALPRILELYPKAGRIRRGHLAELLGVIGREDEKVEALLLEDLKKRGLNVHPNVVKALGEIGSTKAVPELLALYPRTSSKLRGSFTCALAQIADVRTGNLLCDGLDDEDRLVRNTCADGLSRSLLELKKKATARSTDDKYKPLRDKVIKYIESGRHENTRLVLIGGMGRVNDPQALGPLRRLARVDSTSVRVAAVRALGTMKATDAVDDLIQVLYVKEDVLRSATVSSLAAIGSTRCVPALIEQLGTVKARQRREIVRALRQLTGQRFGDNPDQWTHWWSR